MSDARAGGLVVDVDGSPRRIVDPRARLLDPPPPVTPVPLAPDRLAGLTQLEGEVLPAVWAGRARTAVAAVCVTTPVGRAVVLCGRPIHDASGEPLDVARLLDGLRQEVRG